MTRSDELFLRDLVVAVPELRPLLDEHLEDDGEMLPHVFMGEVQSWAEKHATAQPEVVRRVVDELDRGLRIGDDAVQNVIAVSFLEYLPAPGESGGEVRGMLTPLLTQELHELETS